MGVYNTITIECPNCGGDIDCQTKSGSCACLTYNLEDAPDADMLNINRHAPFECRKCGQQNIKVEYDITEHRRVKNRKVVSR